ncbi:MAG: 30S ribosomal protein S6 [Ruminococcaceae bacterium]|nr:30S ribosomal protein S6 [Oscillospiraceae bacterium]
MNSYETLFITDVSNGEEATKATVEKFTSLIASNGEIIEVNEWGKRRLAYPINDMPEGYYTVVTHKSAPSFLAELDRLFNIDESVMRSMTVKLEHEPVKTVKAEEVVEETVVEETVEEAAPAEVEATDAE